MPCQSLSAYSLIPIVGVIDSKTLQPPYLTNFRGKVWWKRQSEKIIAAQEMLRGIVICAFLRLLLMSWSDAFCFVQVSFTLFLEKHRLCHPIIFRYLCLRYSSHNCGSFTYVILWNCFGILWNLNGEWCFSLLCLMPVNVKKKKKRAIVYGLWFPQVPAKQPVNTQLRKTLK